MPVTAKLSRKFYEKLGDDVAGELVDWFNAVDAAYRSELKETNDLNWQRFKDYMDAQLDGRLNKLQAELMKWMFIYWVGSVMTTAALVVGMMRLGR